MSDRTLLRPLALVGGGAMVLALLWWFAVFGTVVRAGYGSYLQAGQCLWGHDYVCTLLLSLCTLDHPLIPKLYRPELFWAGAALLAGAAAIRVGVRWRNAA